MKIAVITDIHSNYLSFEAALADVRNLAIDSIIFLGDYVTDYPYPQRTMKLLYLCREQYNCFFIKGNREEYLLTHRANPDDGWCYGYGSGSLLYTYEALTAADLDFFEAMPICMDISVDGCPKITACHGVPDVARAIMHGNEEYLQRYTENADCSLLLCGHGHRHGCFRRNGVDVLCCGALSSPTDDINAASYVIIESNREGWKHTIRYIDFDRKQLKSDFFTSGMCEKAGFWSRAMMESIRTRKKIVNDCVNYANELATRDGKTGSQVDKNYWEAAAEKFGVKNLTFYLQ